MIEIKNRTGAVIFRDENASTIKEAVNAFAKQARDRGGRAYLGRAYLGRAYLERAARMIYRASTGRAPFFYDTNEGALADIKRCAAEDASEVVVP